MTAVRLHAEPVAKPWGRRDLAPWAADVTAAGAAVGELIYRRPDQRLGSDAALLVKTIFTSERLSVQVHPTDAAARARGLPHGKDEAWIVLAADPGATIGCGFTAAADAADLRAAAQSGAIVALLDWRPVAAGSVFQVPAGTVHAIGGGITLFEVQQNLDITYRLHDYGRGRALHLDAGLAVALRDVSPATPLPRALGAGRTVLIDGGAFVVERVRLGGAAALAPADRRPVWLAAVAGGGSIDGTPFAAGEVWCCDSGTGLEGQAELLLAYPGGEVVADVWSGVAA